MAKNLISTMVAQHVNNTLARLKQIDGAPVVETLREVERIAKTFDERVTKIRAARGMLAEEKADALTLPARS